VPDIARKYGIGRDALLNAADRQELSIMRGPRQKLLVERAEIDRWLASRPYARRMKKIPSPGAENDWERRAEQQLKQLTG